MQIKELKGKHFRDVLNSYHPYYFSEFKNQIEDDMNLDEVLNVLTTKYRSNDLTFRCNYVSTENFMTTCPEECIDKIVSCGIYCLAIPILDGLARRFYEQPEKLYELYLKFITVLYEKNKIKSHRKKVSLSYDPRLLGGKIEYSAVICFNCAAIMFVYKKGLKLNGSTSIVNKTISAARYWKSSNDDSIMKVQNFLYNRCRYGLEKSSRASGSNLIKEFGYKVFSEEMMFDFLETDHNSLRCVFRGKNIGNYTLKELAQKDMERTKKLAVQYFNKEFISKSMEDFRDAIQEMKYALSAWRSGDKLWDEIQDFAFDLDPKLQGCFIASDLN